MQASVCEATESNGSEIILCAHWRHTDDMFFLQFPQAGRGGVPVTMNGLPGNAARGSVGSNVAGINLGAAGRPGMDRGGPGGVPIPQPAANAGMQRGGTNLNALFLNNQASCPLVDLGLVQGLSIFHFPFTAPLSLSTKAGRDGTGLDIHCDGTEISHQRHMHAGWARPKHGRFGLGRADGPNGGSLGLGNLPRPQQCHEQPACGQHVHSLQPALQQPLSHVQQGRHEWHGHSRLWRTHCW